MDSEYWYFRTKDEKKKSKIKKRHYFNMIEYEMIKNKEYKNAKEVHYLNR